MIEPGRCLPSSQHTTSTAATSTVETLPVGLMRKASLTSRMGTLICATWPRVAACSGGQQDREAVCVCACVEVSWQVSAQLADTASSLECVWGVQKQACSNHPVVTGPMLACVHACATSLQSCCQQDSVVWALINLLGQVGWLAGWESGWWRTTAAVVSALPSVAHPVDHILAILYCQWFTPGRHAAWLGRAGAGRGPPKSSAPLQSI